MAIDHFEKHYYQKDRIDWNFNVLFDGQPAVAAMANQYEPFLQHPGLYQPIPAEWLHSTILRVGLTDEYSEAEMLTVAGLLGPKLAVLKLPEFVFDSWWIWGGVVLHATPEDQFSWIYEEVIASLEAVVGPKRTTKSPHGNFIAHMSLAYTRTHHKELEIHRRLLENPVEPATFRAVNLSLIKQYAKDGHYEWEKVKDIPIGQN